jgi:biuret amidohydrolase
MSDQGKIREMINDKRHMPIAIERDKCALVIVDVQRYFTHPEAAFAKVFQAVKPGAIDGYLQRVGTVLPRIQELQGSFRSLHLPVIFVVTGTHTGDGRDLPDWIKDFDVLAKQVLGERAHPTMNDWSWQVDDLISPVPGELVLNKASSGALASTKLDQLLRNMGINSLVVCGLTTAVCVGQTAREHADRGFRVVIAEDACTEMSQEMHEASLLSFAYVFGQVRESREIIEFLSATSLAGVQLEAAPA